MPEHLIIAKIILCMVGAQVTGYQEGVGAYYAPGLMQEVCERRVRQGWQPDLDCANKCLVSAIEPEHLGEWWVVYHPSLSYHLCLTVDVGAEAHLNDLRRRGEVVEISWDMAQAAGWDGYQDNVRIWRLANEPNEERASNHMELDRQQDFIRGSIGALLEAKGESGG